MEHDNTSAEKQCFEVLNSLCCRVEFSAERVVSDCNERFEQAIGVAREDLIGRSISDFSGVSSDGQQVKEILEAAFNGNSCIVKVSLGCSTEPSIWLEATFIASQSSEDQPVSVTILGQDVTSKEQALALSQGFDRAVEESQLVAEYDLEGTFINANMLFCISLGEEQEDLAGRKHHEFSTLNPEDEQKFWQELREGQPQLGTFVLVDSEGNKLWLDGVYAPVYDSFGKMHKVVQVVHNNTFQKLAEFEATGKVAAVERSQLVAEYAVDGEILSSNDIFKEKFGYDQVELNGRNHELLYGNEFVQSDVFKSVWEKLLKGESAEVVWKKLDKEGKTLYVHSVLGPISNDKGEIIKILELGRDETEKVERDRLFNEELVAASEGLASSMEKLGAWSASLRDGALKAKEASNRVNERSGQMKEDLSTTASATTELDASISEITETIVSSSRKVTEAVEMMTATSAIIAELNVHSNNIGVVTESIGKIAAQTNLLALNASIEASRAGEFGRGFAVVAHEVKQLARQTSVATKNIGELVKSIKAGTIEAQSVSKRLQSSIGQINEMSSSIACAVEEQSATSSEVAQTTGRVTGSVGEVLDEVQDMSKLIASNEEIADSLSKSVQNLEAQATAISLLAAECQQE